MTLMDRCERAPHFLSWTIKGCSAIFSSPLVKQPSISPSHRHKSDRSFLLPPSPSLSLRTSPSHRVAVSSFYPYMSLCHVLLPARYNFKLKCLVRSYHRSADTSVLVVVGSWSALIRSWCVFFFLFWKSFMKRGLLWRFKTFLAAINVVWPLSQIRSMCSRAPPWAEAPSIITHLEPEGL